MVANLAWETAINVLHAMKDNTFQITDVLILVLIDLMNWMVDAVFAFLPARVVKIVLQMVAQDACKDITYKKMVHVLGANLPVLNLNLNIEFLK